MNVHDSLKSLTVEQIAEDYASKSHDASFAMTHVSGDFNLGNVIRSANFFGFKGVYYVGGSKQYDRRSTVGTHHYIPVTFVKTEEQFLGIIQEFNTPICIENNVPKYSHKTVSIYDKPFDNLTLPPVFIVGEEQLGLSEYMLTSCERIITIPAKGTVRSLNVGSCASIVMAMYVQHLMAPSSKG